MAFWSHRTWVFQMDFLMTLKGYDQGPSTNHFLMEGQWFEKVGENRSQAKERWLRFATGLVGNRWQLARVRVADSAFQSCENAKHHYMQPYPMVVYSIAWLLQSIKRFAARSSRWAFAWVPNLAMLGRP